MEGHPHDCMQLFGLLHFPIQLSGGWFVDSFCARVLPCFSGHVATTAAQVSVFLTSSPWRDMVGWKRRAETGARCRCSEIK